MLLEKTKNKTCIYGCFFSPHMCLFVIFFKRHVPCHSLVVSLEVLVCLFFLGVVGKEVNDGWFVTGDRFFFLFFFFQRKCTPILFFFSILVLMFFITHFYPDPFKFFFIFSIYSLNYNLFIFPIYSLFFYFWFFS
jgi:hypothetical protein